MILKPGRYTVIPKSVTIGSATFDQDDSIEVTKSTPAQTTIIHEKTNTLYTFPTNALTLVLERV